MITLYYHLPTKEWYHLNTETTYRFGNNGLLVPFDGSERELSLPFQISTQAKKLGPLVGILVGSSTNRKSFVGNLPTLRRLQSALLDKGALGIVMTPQSLSENFIEGFIYYSPLRRWIKLRTPHPDIVYNRIPLRKMESTLEYEQIINFFDTKKIPYFNPFFFSKWETHKTLCTNPKLTPHLPHTIKFQSKHSLIEMLKTYSIIYVKASLGHKGSGIYKIEKMTNKFKIESTNWSKIVSTFTELWDTIHDQVENEEFIIQEAISSDLYEDKRYDLRVLAHYKNNSYSTSGIGIRLSGNQQVTTHLPSGGTLLEFNKINSRIDEEKVREIISEIGETLSTQLGKFIGEFSVDIGKSLSGSYYIYEVNSKPMVFDEPLIQEKGLDNLVELLIMKAKTTI